MIIDKAPLKIGPFVEKGVLMSTNINKKLANLLNEEVFAPYLRGCANITAAFKKLRHNKGFVVPKLF